MHLYNFRVSLQMECYCWSSAFIIVVFPKKT